MRLVHAGVVGLAVLTGCERYDSGAGEPLRVREGEFHPGELPEDPEATEPRVTNAASVGSVVTEGQSSIPYAGLTTTDAWSVAVAIPDVGTGYWTVPVQGPDVTQNGELVFDMVLEFGRAVPFGVQTVSFSALNEQGEPGPRYDTLVCVLPEVGGTSFAACEPTIAPQHTVVSLTWDTDVDLDLVVVAPNGKIVRPKTPTTVISETGPIPNPEGADPTTGALSRDSNGGCDIDSIRRESLVFVGEPPAGEYRVYASLNATCGRSYVNYRASLFQRRDLEDGGWAVDESSLGGGQLIALQADGGASLGTLITTLSLP